MSSTLLKNVLPLFLLATFVAMAAAGISDGCLRCICRKEGCEGQVGRCRQDAGSLSCGPYQIKNIYWIDAYRPGRDYQSCTKQFSCSETAVRAYMNRHGPGCRSNPTCEDYLRMHNGGPYACRPGTGQYRATTGYWNDAKRLCGL